MSWAPWRSPSSSSGWTTWDLKEWDLAVLKALLHPPRFLPPPCLLPKTWTRHDSNSSRDNTCLSAAIPCRNCAVDCAQFCRIQNVAVDQNFVLLFGAHCTCLNVI